MRLVVIVQARMGSARLPGKSMMPIGRVPMIVHVLQRARAIDGVMSVALTTSVNSRDTPLAEVAESLGVRAFRDDEHDVLTRYLNAAAALGAEAVMRVTGDCPLLAPDVCDRVVAAYQANRRVPYQSNDTTQSGYPDGVDCEVFSFGALHCAARWATTATDREHVTPWMRRHLPTAIVRNDIDLRRLKWSVDCKEDLERVRAIYGRLTTGDFLFDSTVTAAKGVR